MNLLFILNLLTLAYSFPSDFTSYCKDVQETMDTYASMYNTSFQFAVVSERMNASFAAGV